MTIQNNFIILSEGIKPTVISFLIAVFVNIFISNILGYLLFFLTLFVAYIYRNTYRKIKRIDKEIISIVDGTINAIDINKKITKVYISVSILDSHTLRAPIDGQIICHNQTNGLNLNPNSFNALKLNSFIDLSINNIDINFLSGLYGNNLEIYNSNVIKGDHIGLFLNGIVTMSFKSKDIKLNINIGDKIKSGQTVIAFNK
jgi:phosphatidylserine decarboxylase